MNTRRRVLVGVLGLVLLGVGLGCFNYTAPSKRENHVAWAEEKGLPAPSEGIFIAGVVALAVGIVGVGVGLGAGQHGS